MRAPSTSPGLTHLHVTFTTLWRGFMFGIALVGTAIVGATAAVAGSVNAAVAANFAQVATELAAKFTAATGTEVRLSFGASGALYAQITQAAPFDVFFSADDQRPAALIEGGFGVAGSAFTYAMGKVVLYSATLDVAKGDAVLEAGAFHHIAIADPNTAPYGAAAMAVLDRLGLTVALTPKIVSGENITQALQFVDSGSAELGFVALSQVAGKPAVQVWQPPQQDYPPIRQNAVLLKHGEDNEAAQAFLDYVKSDAAKAAIKAAGYAVD
jgi:molybdate transport system substrate-binding protein